MKELLIMDGLVLVDKKVGATSYDVVKLVKRHFNTNKVGHCGTLDPFASGLLIIGFNQATKVMSFLEHEYKEYETVTSFLYCFSSTTIILRIPTQRQTKRLCKRSRVKLSELD